MKDVFITIVLGIFTSYIYDFLKSKNNPKSPPSFYSIKALRIEFYSSLTALLLSIWILYEYDANLVLIVVFLSSILLYFSFECSIDMVKHLLNKYTDKK